MLTEKELQKVVEYERGYLDQKHSMGYCGNTEEYDAGYFEVGPEYYSMEKAQSQRREIVMRGWI